MQWVRAVVFFAGAMACASIHRVTFSVLAIPIREEFALSLPQMGILQSAVLAGYIIGQVGASLGRWGMASQGSTCFAAPFIQAQHGAVDKDRKALE